MTRRLGMIGMATATLVIGLAALLAMGGGQQPSRQRAAPVPLRAAVIVPPVVGMNLGQSQTWGQEWVFADLIRNNGLLAVMGKDTLEGLKVDETGHPYDIPRGTELGLLLQSSAVWRTGVYDCHVSPGWKYHSQFLGTISGSGETFRLTVPKGWQGQFVKLSFTAERDGARFGPATCMPVGFAPDTVFNPVFLADMKGFKIIRFMDWMQTNNAPLRTWADRPKPDDLSQLRRGMAVEYMVDLANTLGADPWFTLPMDADPAYYRNFAIYVRDHLAPGRKAYVELSNEVWNPGFKQAQDAIKRGKARYPKVEDYQAGDFYYADRVREMMTVWGEVFAGQMPRIVRVAAGQIQWKERSDALLAHNDLWKSIDAYAVACYFGSNIQDIDETGPVRVTKGLNRLTGMARKLVDDMALQKAVVEKYGIPYITYEGGPDVNGFSPDAQVDAAAITHDPRMYDIYTNFLEDWGRRIGGPLVLYNGTSATNYGHKDYTGQPLGEAPKMRAVLDFMGRHPK